MPSLLLLLIMSLTVASAPASTRNKSAKIEGKTAKALPNAAKKADDKAVRVSMPVVAEVPSFIAPLRELTFGLTMQSETDAPMRVEYWDSKERALSPDQVAILAAVPNAKPVEITTVAKFFANAVKVEDWMNDEEKAVAKRFQKLSEMLEIELENPQVYLFGEREKTVVVIGKVKGGYGGLVTLVVET